MNRTVLINHLLFIRHGTRYLEIGVHDENENFAHVRSPHKVGVDVQPVTTVQATSDEFFAGNGEQFDVIFIDGLHTEEQVARDIEYAHRCLASGGAIVLHDCLPPDAWHQREPEAVSEGENWNGTVWKAALREFDRSQHWCAIVDADWGCGVIDTAQTQVPAGRVLPEELEYDRDFPLLQPYVISAPAYMRDQLKVVYHLACIGDWRAVFGEQMALLRECGFPPVDLTILGADDDLAAAHAMLDELELEARVLFQAPELTHFEAPALLAIEAYAQENDGYVLYLHSKGVSNTADGLKARWRRLMMRELVQNWERCMFELWHYDAIGVNWRDMRPISHFSGNFWYASTRYLRTLADFRTYYDNPRYRVWDAINDKRLGCEFWIGSGDTSPHVLSLVCRNEDFCGPRFWASGSD